MLRQRTIVCSIALAWLAQCVTAVSGGQRIFPYYEAETARRLAQRECKPLVLHFIPDDQYGASQLESFYTGRQRVSEDVLEAVVIVVVPTEKYAAFAKKLGVTGPGGYRTVSAFDLSAFDKNSTPTCRTGFR